MHRQKGLHHGHGDFVGLKGNHCTVAADDLVMGQRVGMSIGRNARFLGTQNSNGFWGYWGYKRLHGFLFLISVFVWVLSSREGLATSAIPVRYIEQDTLYLGSGVVASHYR
jgi:hypothetical protein